MKYLKGIMGLLMTISIMGAGMDAYGFLGFGGTSWQEEVLLHDGGKIIVKRSQSYGGRSEIGQTPPIKEQEITFALPGTNKTITWKSEYSEDVGRANFKLLALHILDGTPYVVAAPNLCLSYNKWGRPNPPYVFFKFTNEAWQRIAISEFPAQFEDINVVIDTKTNEKAMLDQSPVPAEIVRKFNNLLTQPEYKTILREPLSKERCPQYHSGPKAPGTTDTQSK